MFWLSLADISRAQYTRWAYLEVMVLIPAMFYFPLARRIALVNTMGLGFGIQAFYVVTNYNLLREFGDKLSETPFPFPVLLIGDFLYHWMPWVILQFVFSDEYSFQLNISASWSKLWIGAMTGFAHGTYLFWLSCIRFKGIQLFDVRWWDPRDAYEVKCTKIATHAIPAAWMLLICGHLAASSFVLNEP